MRWPIRIVHSLWGYEPCHLVVSFLGAHNEWFSTTDDGQDANPFHFANDFIKLNSHLALKAKFILRINFKSYQESTDDHWSIYSLKVRLRIWNRSSLTIVFIIIIFVAAMFFLKKIKDKAFIPIDAPAFNRENMEYTLRNHLEHAERIMLALMIAWFVAASRAVCIFELVEDNWKSKKIEMMKMGLIWIQIRAMIMNTKFLYSLTQFWISFVMDGLVRTP